MNALNGVNNGRNGNVTSSSSTYNSACTSVCYSLVCLLSSNLEVLVSIYRIRVVIGSTTSCEVTTNATEVTSYEGLQEGNAERRTCAGSQLGTRIK